MDDVSIPFLFLLGALAGAGIVGILFGWLLRDRSR